MGLGPFDVLDECAGIAIEQRHKDTLHTAQLFVVSRRVLTELVECGRKVALGKGTADPSLRQIEAAVDRAGDVTGDGDSGITAPQ